MDSCMEMAPGADLVTTMSGSHLRPRAEGAPRALSAGWRLAPAAMAITDGHRYNQIKFPPRMGPPTCSPPV